MYEPHCRITPTVKGSGDEWVDASLLHMRLVLTESMAFNIRFHLPVTLRFTTQWKLGYSSRTHGVSLQTFFRQSEMFDGPSVIIISSISGEIFGGFASSPWIPSGGKYYGDPSAFTFRIRNDEEKTLDTFLWNVTNDCFQFSDSEGLGMGGGEEGPAWYISSDFMHGVSSSCPTFGNPMFTPDRDFIVAGFEAWYFESDMWTGQKTMIRKKGPWDDIMRASSNKDCRSLPYTERPSEGSHTSDAARSNFDVLSRGIALRPSRIQRISRNSAGAAGGRARERERSNLFDSSISLDPMAIARPRSCQFLPTG
eukprot:GEMP01041076.1.p1 GENE.GEMP01041076.1~~GEMP01041076.1.p1  ORF type:complete len:310 (+),score=39.22 GEMP01041076.1:253-1182(+)